MNTVELAHRLTRHLDVSDIGNLSARSKQELAGEITAGLMEFYENVPDVWSRTTFSFRIPKARTLTASVVNGSNSVGNVPFFPSERGCTVVFGGNTSEWNDVVATDQVLDTYPGETGDVQAVVYPDAIAIQNKVIKRIVSDPRLHNNGWVLTRDDRVQYNGDYRRHWNKSGWRRFGTPVRYGVEYGGQSQGSDLVTLLRLDPIPQEQDVIRFEADYYPDPVQFSEMSEPRDIPVADGHANLILIPLIEERLIGSSMWNGSDKAERSIGTQAQRARVEMARMMPDFAKPRNKVGTKAGW